MFRALVATAAMIIMTVANQAAHAESPDLIVKESAVDFATTVRHLQAEIEKRGAKIVAIVDHAAAANASGFKLRPTTVLIFGNPILGTPLMEGRQTAGLDLPLRVLVWQDASNKVQIGYWPPSRIADTHGIENKRDIMDKMTTALNAITDAAAKR
ncbi:DUF302 domain-containing protein (plasmid) [Rhizobium sullae]|uniref:DUF302 domain-containing protein n=1 Tax=Rhizobium sullae TaxID=50338 RepID=A0A2N0D1J6_RHISU|nr:DUF302 domain-containing protein [Rhizobium sullae]PKA39928.1 DUF302 domain-containing protein [Rhizobium sullae]UWU16914.1 DUF302 domain-containing protein [Rhizobium sullae]